MKIKNYLTKFLLVFTLLLSITLNAQTINTEYATKINQAFAGVNKNNVPHSLLVDYAMEFTDLASYNGTLTNQNYVHKGTFTSIYNTLLMARVKTGVTSLVSPTVFKQNWNSRRKQDTIMLSGLYYKYSQFKDNAHPNYITVSNNKLYDKYVNGVWQNPYNTKQVFAMASPILKYKGLSVNVQVPHALWYTNQASAVQSIEIDFGNSAGYINMPLGSTFNVQYAQEGIYNWTYKLTLTNNQVLYSHSKINIEGQLPPSNNQNYLNRTINEPCSVNEFGIDQVDFVGTQTYLGTANTATIEIDYREDNDCNLTRPLIVAEGFDSGLLGVENGLGDNDYNGFINRDIPDGGFQLGNEITDYDIIYVNWDNSRDHLQRNALLLEDIIQWVNTVKAANGSTEPNVVLGQSMGGVIARYALADMEQRSLTHDTSLYISHDAPHQGANIPLSIQYFARHLADQFISTPLGDYSFSMGNDGSASIEEINNLFNAVGTQQLLTNYINPNFGLDNSVHSAWQADLLLKGYPTQTRNIAISNGNHCAITQDYNYNASLFLMYGDARTGVLTDLLGSFLGIADDIALAVVFDEAALILGVLPGSSKFSLDFNAKALPIAGTNANIYKGKVTYTKKLLWFLNITLTLTNRSYNNPVNLSFDKYAGGRYEFLNGISNINTPDDDGDLTQFQADLISALIGSANITFDIEPTFGFVPTPSALDVGSGNANLNNQDYLKSYTAANLPTGSRSIPFDNFTTSHQPNNSINERHISFNTRNGNWLATELNTDPTDTDIFDCTKFCSDAEIIGEDYLCTTGLYSVTNDANPSFTNWTVNDPNNLVTFTTSGNEITINQLNQNQNGQITITVFYRNTRCGSIEVTRDIWVGNPKVNTNGINSNYSNVSTNSTSQFSVAWAEGNTHYYWSVTPNTTCNAGSGPTIQPTSQNTYNSTSRYASINWGACPGTYSVVCFAKNDCGITYIGQKWITVYDPYDDNPNDPCSQEPWSLKTYPNPVKGGSIIVSKLPPGNPCNDNPFGSLKQANSINDVKIYDFYGNIVYKNSFNSNDFNISGLKLRTGHYILNVSSSDGQVLRKLLLVE